MKKKRTTTAPASGHPAGRGRDSEVSARRQAEAALKQRLAIEQLLAASSSRLANVTPESLDKAVRKVLADVGRLMKVDRCYLFRVTDDLAIADNTHEWCAAGISTQIARLRNLPTRTFRWMLKQMSDGEALCIPKVADIPREGATERQFMQRGHIQAAVFVPIRHGGRLTGFVGCDMTRNERLWSDADVRLLRIMGEGLADAQARCRAGEAVRSAAREWQDTFDGVEDAIFVLDAKQHILRSNKAASLLFGKSMEEMIGHRCCQIAHGTREPLPGCPVARMKRSHKRESLELAREGRWHQVVVDPLFGPDGTLRGAVHIVTDITARKRAEESLRDMAVELERRVEDRTAAWRKTAERLQRTMVAANAVAWELDLASGMLLENGPVEKFRDDPKGSRYGTDEDFFARIHPDDRDYVRAQVKRAVESEGGEHTAEFRLVLPEGRILWMGSSGSIERNAAGQPVSLRGISLDITARKQSEVALARTHRALRVLTEGNRMLLRATSEQELLNAACRIAVEVGGYRMAWVGYAEADARKSIRPMAQVGIGAEDLCRLPRTWADSRLGRGPAGVAIRSGQPCVCRDAAKDPLFAPWRKEALEFGYVAVLALPLMSEQGCLGQLTVCSTQSDAFDGAGLQLLQQLANDLAFGIMGLRNRMERKDLERQVLDIGENVQRRIGQDLHDGVSQSIIGIGYLVSAVHEALVNKAAPEAAKLERVTRLVWKTVEEMRDMARGLFPGELMDGQLADALQELARHTQDVFGMACHFTGPPAVSLADAKLASQVYRIAQEAVNNAAKHSRADEIRIGLSQENGSMVLTVRDTGVGIPEKTGPAAGLGQRIMKYRADLIGAALRIESVRGQGTTVTCALPVPE